MTNESLDADELKLEKKDIIRLIESVQKRLRKRGGASKIYLAGLALFKQGINWTDDEIIKLVWHDMVRLTNTMMEYNARKRMLGEMPKTADMLAMLEKEIDSDDFAGEPAI